MLKLKEIHIKNFKSLRDCKLKLGNFNVLVGANATGKTNLVDLFLLLRKIYVEKDINPFRYWWGYQNAVWNRREELDISVRFLFDYVDGDKTYEVRFETTFTGRGGKFEILREKLEIEGFISFELSGGVLGIKFDEKWKKELEQVIKKLKRSKTPVVEYFAIDWDYNRLKPVAVDVKSLFELKKWSCHFIPIGRRYLLAYYFNGYYIPTLFMIRFDELDELLYSYNLPKMPEIILNDIQQLISDTIILKLNINEIKRPSPLRREDLLIEDGSNLNSVLYNLFLKKNRIPDRIATLISYLFPNINLGFSITEDQRVYLKVQEDGLELPPVCIADGLYKLLAILTALELKPSLLIIDEVENSLHPETLEKLLDELKSSETTVIITTHSPVVVDMTDPADLVIVEKIAGETKFRRIENPEEIKKKLREAGITFSEGWLYGQI